VHLKIKSTPAQKPELKRGLTVSVYFGELFSCVFYKIKSLII